MDTNSESSSTQQTSTSTTDARVGADNGSIVIQQGGQQNISFSPEVASLASKVVGNIVDFSNGVVHTAGDVLQKSLATQEALSADVLNFGKSALAAAPGTQPAVSAGLIQSVNYSQLKIPLIIGGAVLLFILLKKGKI